ncbi:hypothetical protein Q1695_002856 [Nippostrongylus brasiliensis]|nr:hypothetical protein Q1695_002856 [Nippostrongylus brasiliensis]
MTLPLDLPLGDITEVEFVEWKFLSFPESSQILVVREHSSNAVIDPSLNIHTCLINAYGRLHFVEQNKTVHLPKLLAEVPLENGHSIELSSADMSASSNQGCLAILATSWVELNEHFCPCRHFGALFKISPTLHVELMKKIEAAAPIAHCCLADKVVNFLEQKFWIIYESERSPTVYKLEGTSNHLQIVENDIHVFPELSLDDCSGTVLRTAEASSERLNWKAFGFDNGRVFLLVFDKDTKVVNRKLIKFSGPVSVVLFAPYQHVRTPKSGEEADSTPVPYQEERYIVVSSTLGPVAIWRCSYEGDTLFWNSEIILSQSEQFDAITSACIIGDNIAVGTSSGKILFYSSPCDLLSHEISSMTQLHSPIVNMRVVDEKTLCVLSTAGLHTVKRSDV